jgi:hexosaminidase
MDNAAPILLPQPKKINFFEGKKKVNGESRIIIPSEGKNELFSIARRLKAVVQKNLSVEIPILVGKEGDISFKKASTIKDEAYSLHISKNNIDIHFGGFPGAFHAVSTLKQLILQYGKAIPCMVIEDEPDFKRRGIMVDISRDKIPTMDTLYKIIDFMADVKLNELQLYIEGFSFAYDSFPGVWSSGTPITSEEMMLLDRYCSDRYIDFVPNQNSFGHMSPWLHRKEFEHLADCPEGCLTPWGTFIRSSTLNPLDEGSIELVAKQYDDLLPNFTTEYFNVGLDEPFELGHGKSKKVVEELGDGRVYLDYLLKIYKEVKYRNKRMMFWGDIIIKSPELIPELPKDIIAMEWGYEENHPFAENCEKYKAAGLDFYVCPGTSSWCSILGRTDNMKRNLLNAALSGLKNGAVGYLNTDWGDMGHIQYLPVSYPAYVYGAALSWCVEKNSEFDIELYLNKFIFKDENNIMGKLMMDLGNYYLLETARVGNATKLFWMLNNDLEDLNSVKGFLVQDFKKVGKHLEDLENKLKEAHMKCDDADLISKEIENGIRYVLHAVKRTEFMFNEYEDSTKLLQELGEDIEAIMKNHCELWLSRNRVGGMEQSLDYMRRLKKQYK